MRVINRNERLAVVPVGKFEIAANAPCSIGSIELRVTDNLVWLENFTAVFGAGDSFVFNFNISLLTGAS